MSGVEVFSGCTWTLQLTQSDMRGMETAAAIRSLRPKLLRMDAYFGPNYEPYMHYPEVVAENAVPRISQSEQAMFSLEAAASDEACLKLLASGVSEQIKQRESSPRKLFRFVPPTRVQRETCSVVPVESLWDSEAFVKVVSYMVGEGSRILIKQTIENFESVNDQWRAADISQELDLSASHWWQAEPAHYI